MHNGSLRRSPMHLLHRALQRADDCFLHDVPTDLTPRQLVVLLAVAETEGANQTRLVDATGIDRSTLADIVRRLVKRHLLKRRRGRRDARSYSVKLTDEGRQMLLAAEPVGKDVDQRILDILPPDCRRQFLASLQMIINSLDCPNLGSKRPQV
jgi:MarR family transcriptional regulator, temperature-dependent positive regulator of motility